MRVKVLLHCGHLYSGSIGVLVELETIVLLERKEAKEKGRAFESRLRDDHDAFYSFYNFVVHPQKLRVVVASKQHI